MTRKPALADGETARTACARVLVRGGADENTGEALTTAALAERVGWCAALVQGMAARLVAGHWHPVGLESLASGRDAAGRPLPAMAWMALRRLGWGTVPPGGVTVNDRIVRMAQEQAGRVLRSACGRDGLTRAVAATWPADPGKRTGQEWDAVRAAMPGGEHLPSAVIRARTRQAARHLRDHGRLPGGVTELEAPPHMPGMLILAACDRQQAVIERHEADPRRALLRLQLPTRPDPHVYQDWTWVAVPLNLPPTVPAGAALHLPTLRIAGGRVQADVAFTMDVPQAKRAGHTVALGLDWGLNTLLSAGACRLNPDGTATALGAGAQYRAGGVLAKAGRLRRQGEALHAKLGHCQRLTAGDKAHALTAQVAVLTEEARRVGDRRSHLNDALAWSAARWAADQAIATRATVIYVEDLRSMEARGMGRSLNVRLSQTVRGKSSSACGPSPPSTASPSSPSRPGAPRRTAPAACRRYATARHPTDPARRGGSGPGAPAAAGRATATTAPGSGSPPAASPTRPKPLSVATAGPWPSALSRPGSKPAPLPPPTLRGAWTVPRAARRPGEVPHAARPGDARHPPRRARTGAAVSVRRDTRERPGNCPAQPPGTSA